MNRVTARRGARSRRDPAALASDRIPENLASSALEGAAAGDTMRDIAARLRVYERTLKRWLAVDEDFRTTFHAAWECGTARLAEELAQLSRGAPSMGAALAAVEPLVDQLRGRGSLGSDAPGKLIDADFEDIRSIDGDQTDAPSSIDESQFR